MPEVRTALISGIPSYQGVEHLRQYFAGRSLSWEVLEDRRHSATNFRPRFDVYTVSIRAYSYLGHSGELTIKFFNDRLMETSFFPTDFNGFLTVLAVEEGIDLRGRQEITLPPYTHVWTAEDYKKRRYVGWEDARLAEEMRLWIKRYA